MIPFSVEVPVGPLNMFSLYDDRLAAIEDCTGLLMLRDPTDVRYYTELFEFTMARWPHTRSTRRRWSTPGG